MRLTAGRAREAFDYDPLTGQLIWKIEPKSGNRHLGDIAGTITKKGYVLIGIDREQIHAPRVIWLIVHGVELDKEPDHRDGDPSNNRLANLRPATSSQQKRNKCVQSNNRSGLKGAFYHEAHKGKKWRSQIKVGKRLIFLGYHYTAEEAHAAYGASALEHFGEFARLS